MPSILLRQGARRELVGRSDTRAARSTSSLSTEGVQLFAQAVRRTACDASAIRARGGGTGVAASFLRWPPSVRALQMSDDDALASPRPSSPSAGQSDGERSIVWQSGWLREPSYCGLLWTSVRLARSCTVRLRRPSWALPNCVETTG